MNSNVLLALGLTLFLGCQNFSRPTIEITKDYVYNSNWGTDNKANFSIQRIFLNDSVGDNLAELTAFEILNSKKKYDSTYFYIVAPHDNQNIEKIFFNKKNDGIQWYVNRDLKNKKDKVGKLEFESWYQVGGLYKTWTYFVYIDDKGDSHVWKVNPVNY